MKKKFLLLSFLLLASLPMVFAETGSDPAVPESSEKKSGDLVNLSDFRSSSRLDDLSRRISDLERDARSQTDRIRNLERTVNDLQRRSN